MNARFREWLELISQRRTFFVSFVVLIFGACVLDFLVRVYIPRDEALRQFTAPTVESLPPRNEGSAIRARLDIALPPPKSSEDLSEAPPREIVLQGVFISKGKKVASMVLLPQGDKPLERKIVEIGGEIDGWSVEHIDNRKVGLSKGTERKELVMFRTR